MNCINLTLLNNKLGEIKQDFNSRKPFRYTIFESFLLPEKAEEILSAYPDIKDGLWDGTTYIDQKNKFQKTQFDEHSIFNQVFDELNSKDFLKWLEDVTEIKELRGDRKLFGGGLHQSIKGAFLNVHVDYNIHPETKLHRRLNVLVYMNKNWKPEYEGFLELWDLRDNNNRLLEKISPDFNRCVIFETNEVSYHGHPKPLKTPDGINRKSIATYYYTSSRPENEITGEHNTLYVNTEGLTGNLKRFGSGIKAFLERIIKR